MGEFLSEKAHEDVLKTEKSENIFFIDTSGDTKKRKEFVHGVNRIAKKKAKLDPILVALDNLKSTTEKKKLKKILNKVFHFLFLFFYF